MASDLTSSAVTFLGAFIFFVLNFNFTWVITARKLRKYFHTFTLGNKADWCSRMNSTVHGLVVVPGFIISVALVKWNTNMEPFDYDDLKYVHVFMSISAAYFIVDLIIILLYRVPMWGVFVTHHIVAVIPLSINVFDPTCGVGAYILGLYLIVELPTLSLNMQVFLEQTGRAQTRLYAIFFYITYVNWIICRCTLPAYLVVVLWNNVFPAVASDQIGCLMPGIFAAHALTIFCYGVFVFVLTKELRGRWQNTKPQDALEVAHVRPGVGDECPDSDLESPVLPPEVVTPVDDEGDDTEDMPTLPTAPELRPPNTTEIDWALGIERPPSVMRHGGSVIR
jgi:hypothetical protein